MVVEFKTPAKSNVFKFDYLRFLQHFVSLNIELLYTNLQTSVTLAGIAFLAIFFFFYKVQEQHLRERSMFHIRSNFFVLFATVWFKHSIFLLLKSIIFY